MNFWLSLLLRKTHIFFSSRSPIVVKHDIYFDKKKASQTSVSAVPLNAIISLLNIDHYLISRVEKFVNLTQNMIWCIQHERNFRLGTDVHAKIFTAFFYLVVYIFSNCQFAYIHLISYLSSLDMSWNIFMRSWWKKFIQYPIQRILRVFQFIHFKNNRD